MIENQCRLYQQTASDVEDWVQPSEDKPITIICHDESTLNAGDQQSHKSSFGFNAAFYDKTEEEVECFLTFFASIHLSLS